ncbi:hypothetical protein AGMMS50267_05680 [Spirochaetia bacterium]|nr:hypothetical protein AGMMS50267_05680 [Spirochaetia bacterium]
MIALLQRSRQVLARFLSKAPYRRILYIALLCGIALVDYLHAGQVRRTFVFYSLDDGRESLEDRMLPKTPSKEAGIRQYAEELLLGPADPGSALLFLPETRVRSLLYRDGVVYLDLSEQAALPGKTGGTAAVHASALPVTPLSAAPQILLDGEGGECFWNLYILNAGIRRNFSFVKDVRLFIFGNEAYPEKFAEIFRKNDKIT